MCSYFIAHIYRTQTSERALDLFVKNNKDFMFIVLQAPQISHYTTSQKYNNGKLAKMIVYSKQDKHDKMKFAFIVTQFGPLWQFSIKQSVNNNKWMSVWILNT